MSLRHISVYGASSRCIDVHATMYKTLDVISALKRCCIIPTSFLRLYGRHDGKNIIIEKTSMTRSMMARLPWLILT